MSATARPTEVKQGCSLTFRDTDTELTGMVNGDPWVYFDGECHARIPVWTDERGPMDVAGENVVSVRADAENVYHCTPDESGGLSDASA